MMLASADIQSMQLIDGASVPQFRAASYDVTVDKIIDHNGVELEKNVYVLPPNGIVEVISKERVKLPDNICGYAAIKTSLCDKGILALNIGLIDPGWKGRVSTTLINFSNRSFPLSKGESFLRLTFHQLTQHTGAPSSEIPDDKYIATKRAKAADFFNERFIDFSKASEEAFGKYKIWLLAWIPFAGVLITIFLGVATYAATYLANSKGLEMTKEYWLPSAQQAKEQLKTEFGRLDLLEKRAKEVEDSSKQKMDELQGRIDQLEREIKGIKRKPPSR